MPTSLLPARPGVFCLSKQKLFKCSNEIQKCSMHTYDAFLMHSRLVCEGFQVLLHGVCLQPEKLEFTSPRPGSLTRSRQNPEFTSVCLRIPIYSSPNATFSLCLCLHLSGELLDRQNQRFTNACLRFLAGPPEAARPPLPPRNV